MSGNGGLIARVRPVGPAFDLLANYRSPADAVLERTGLGVSATGETLRFVSPRADAEAIAELGRRAVRTLASIHREGGEAAPLAIGAIPFDPSGSASLVVPARAVRRDRERETWVVGVAPERGGVDLPEPERFIGATPHEAFEAIQLRAAPTPVAYADAVQSAAERIRAGELRKVVLARTLEVAADRAFDPKRLLWRLRAVDPGCFAFAVPVAEGALVGASPELLVERRGRNVRANPLAGSAPRFGDPDEDRASGETLLASTKDREEHAVVVDAVAAALGDLCDELDHDRDPILLGTANVWHLSTRFRGRLHDPAPNALELVALLHPTPAVCGAPRSVARSIIGELESFDRGAYAGPVGWIDASGDGVWAIALRCAELSGRRARLFAGAGIVADSIPAREVEETERKFQALLDALRWG